MDKDYPAGTKLIRGQAVYCRASRGMTIVARLGRIRIEPAPLWIGEQLVQETFLLQEGEAYAVQQPGMLLIQAQSDADVLCIRTESRFMHAIAAILSILTARLRRFAAIRTGVL